VDQGVRWEGTGAKARKVLEPPPAERMKSIRDLVAGAIGLNAERGDQLIVESLPFESTLQLGPPEGVSAPAPSPASPLPAWLETLRKDPKMLIGAAAAAVILLLALAGAAVAGRRKRRRGVQIASPRELPSAPSATPASKTIAGAADGAKRIEQESSALPELPPPTKKADLLAGRLRDVIKTDPGASAQILRTWLTEEEE
jgi:flagellar biosynthesis/type III secretory pathway M-ring protein FliF/YscJ